MSEKRDESILEKREQGTEAGQQEKQRPATDFSDWIGLGLRAPQNPSPRFSSDDDLWQ